MLYRSFRQLLSAALLLMKVVTGDCAPKATTPFTLKGEVKGRKYPTVLYLLYKENEKVVRDSAILNDGHFVFKGSISRPLSATLYLKKQDGEQFAPPARHLYLDPGVMTLEGNGGVDSAVVEGSPSTKLADDWIKVSRPYLAQLDLLRSRAYYNRGNSDSVRILKDQTDDALTALENALTVFVIRHPNSYVSWDLVDERRVAMHPNTFQPSFEALGPEFRNSPEGKALAEQIVNVKQAEIGVRSPDFSQCGAHGNPISLRSLHGKYVLVDFWASWCGICRMENPNVLKAYNAYKDSGFTVLGVSLDDSKDKWLQAVREDNMPWQQVCDMKGRKNDVALLYGIVGIPQNVLLDPNGVIIAKNLRDRDLMNKLMEIFAAGRNMRLDGHISSLKDSLAVFRYYAGDKLKQDTVAIHDGSFTWQTVMPEPQKIQAMLVPSHHMLQFYSDIGYLELSGQADSLDNLKLKGSWLDEEAKAFAASIKDISEPQKELYAKYLKAAKEDQPAILEQLKKLSEQRSLRVKQYIHAHPQTPLSLSLVYDMTGDDYGEVYPLYMSLTETLRGTPTGHRIATLLPVMKRKAIGEQVMNFSQADSAGKRVSVGDLKGKYVLIDFWASWCGPCRAENPNVLKAYEAFSGKGFTVLGLSLDNDANKWKKAIRDDHMPWTQLSDLKGWKNDVALYYGVQAIPWNILIDPQGKIIAKGLRGADLFKELSSLMN